MPRGVPANGRRRRAGETETSLAGSAVDETVDDFDAPADEETDPDPVPDLIDHEATQPLPPPGDPVPDPLPYSVQSGLSPEQQEIKALRDQLAKLGGKRDVEPVAEAIPDDGENFVIHILEDGLTVLGRVMYRGDELEFKPGSQAYKDTFDRNGRTWLTLRHDEFAQVDRWGKVMFRNGPWPGKKYTDGTFETLRSDRDGTFVKPPSEAEIAAAEKARARRAAPALPAQV
jgi:hypothetical protein